MLYFRFLRLRPVVRVILKKSLYEDNLWFWILLEGHYHFAFLNECEKFEWNFSSLNPQKYLQAMNLSKSTKPDFEYLTMKFDPNSAFVYKTRQVNLDPMSSFLEKFAWKACICMIAKSNYWYLYLLRKLTSLDLNDVDSYLETWQQVIISNILWGSIRANMCKPTDTMIQSWNSHKSTRVTSQDKWTKSKGNEL